MLRIRGLSKNFRFRGTDTKVLHSLHLDIQPGELFVLLGPSGCGKTTTLRSIAGLERPDDGEIAIDGETVFSGERDHFVRPERRPISMVFQSYAVWPHMSVRENIAFPLREGLRRLARNDVHERVQDVLELLQLTAVADRPVTMLSGGQQQRVALARALGLRPKILLMDEPLSNLDAQLQVQLRSQLKELVRRFGLTTVYVTHNQAEAMDLGDRVAIMAEGRLAQLGTPRDVYQCPRNEFVARFIGEMNLVPAHVLSTSDGGVAQLATAMGNLCAGSIRGEALRPGSGCLFGIRPEDVRIVETGQIPRENSLQAKVTDSQFVGEAMLYSVNVQTVGLRIKVHHSVILQPGQEVTLHLPVRHSAAILLAAGTGGHENRVPSDDDRMHGDNCSDIQVVMA